MEQEEAETKLQILLDFLHCLRKQKLEEMNEVFALKYVYLRLLSYHISYYSANAFLLERSACEVFRYLGISNYGVKKGPH